MLPSQGREEGSIPFTRSMKKQINHFSFSSQTTNFVSIVIIAGVLFGVTGFIFGRKSVSLPPTSPESTIPTKESNSSISPTTTSTIISPTANQINGSSLKNINYSLPQNWEAKTIDDSLLLTPQNGGGYLSLKVYTYSGNIGRREYYCQITKQCIDETVFTTARIGNISGYLATRLDNSGGGAEYFGAKGNKFYVISSYNPPSPNDFEKSYKQVMDSLVF